MLKGVLGVDIKITRDRLQKVEKLTRFQIQHFKYGPSVDPTGVERRYFESNIGMGVLTVAFGLSFNEWLLSRAKQFKSRQIRNYILFKNLRWNPKTTIRYPNSRHMIIAQKGPKDVDMYCFIKGTDSKYIFNIVGYMSVETFNEHKYLRSFGTGMRDGWTVNYDKFLPMEGFVERVDFENNPEKAFF
jgi:hypothetical protein